MKYWLTISILGALMYFKRVIAYRGGKNFKKNIWLHIRGEEDWGSSKDIYMWIARWLPFKYTEYQIEEIERKLRWVESPMTAYEYLIKPYMYFLGSICLGICLAYISKEVKTISYCMLAVGVSVGVINLKRFSMKLGKSQIEKREKIILEMPRFIKTLQFSPKTKTLDMIIEDYLKQEKGGLKQDLSFLLADIRTGVEESKALKNFSNRINMMEVTELVALLHLTGIDSRDANVTLQFLGTKFREKTFRIIEKELRKRPERLNILNGLLLNMLILLMLVPVAIQAFGGITSILR